MLSEMKLSRVLWALPMKQLNRKLLKVFEIMNID
jgi:hypothetical protein